jgi:nucleoside-diphosphate-sugar epimerase
MTHGIIGIEYIAKGAGIMEKSDGINDSTCTPIESVQELEGKLSNPTSRLIESISKTDGDIIILGAGGKMGPSLAIMARRAADRAGKVMRIIAIDVFPDTKVRDDLDDAGVETILCNLLSPGGVESLPDAANVVYMVGMKFGSMESQSLTWALNAFLPGLVARRYQDSRIVVFSTGNVYPFVPADSGGADENTQPAPIGQYAQSCLAREMVFWFHSEKYSTPVCIFRLNYAVELRYGVLLDIAQKVWNDEPIDLTMGHFNAIWQADANERALLCLEHCKSPPMVVNVTGPEAPALDGIAARFGELMGKKPIIEKTPSDTALLSDASLSTEMFGPPEFPIDQIIPWVSHWVMNDKPTFAKPTHFDVRDGNF